MAPSQDLSHGPACPEVVLAVLIALSGRKDVYGR